MAQKYNSRQKYGTGWFNESHRHSLARQGVKTGRKDYAKMSLNFKSPIKEEYDVKFKKDDLSVRDYDDKNTVVGWKTSYGLLPIVKIDWLKNTTSRWQIKQVGSKFKVFDSDIGEFLIGYDFDSDVEAKNFIDSLARKKKKRMFESQQEEDEYWDDIAEMEAVDRETKPRDYPKPEYSKRQKSEFLVIVKDFDLDDLPNKLYKFDHGTDLQDNEFEIYFNTKEQVKEFEKFVKSQKKKYTVDELPLDKSSKLQRELLVRFKGVDRQGRKMWINVNTDKVYKEVDNELHTITSQGEPLMPINKEIKIKFI